MKGMVTIMKRKVAVFTSLLLGTPLISASPSGNAQTASDCKPPMMLAAEYINPEKGVETAEEALTGAMDIIAEKNSDDADIRKRMRFPIIKCTLSKLH